VPLRYTSSADANTLPPSLEMRSNKRRSLTEMSPTALRLLHYLISLTLIIVLRLQSTSPFTALIVAVTVHRFTKLLVRSIATLDDLACSPCGFKAASRRSFRSTSTRTRTLHENKDVRSEHKQRPRIASWSTVVNAYANATKCRTAAHQSSKRIIPDELERFYSIYSWTRVSKRILPHHVDILDRVILSEDASRRYRRRQHDSTFGEALRCRQHFSVKSLSDLLVDISSQVRKSSFRGPQVVTLHHA
jgi:hypothetical protein